MNPVVLKWSSPWILLVCSAGVGLSCGATSRDAAEPETTDQLTFPERKLRVGYDRLCSITKERRLWCMGKNNVGQLGDGSNIDRSEPVFVEGLDDVAEVSLGRVHSCARKRTGEVFCWGDNAFGQLGDGTLRFRFRPVQVDGLKGAVKLSTSMDRTFALRDDGSLVCWGSPCFDATEDVDSIPEESHKLVGYFANLARYGTECVGNFRERCAMTPKVLTKVRGLSEVVASSDHLCGAVTKEGTLEAVCVGMNAEHQLGRYRPYYAASPLSVPEVGNLLHISTLEQQTCALESSGAIRCWGPNPGIGGLGTSEFSRVKVRQVTSLTGGVEIARSQHLICGRSTLGQVRCGSIQFGLLKEDPDEEPLVLIPFLGVDDAVGIDVDESLLCIQKSSGSVLCQGGVPGITSGAGDRDETWASDPQPLSGLTGVKGLSTGRLRSCAIDGDGAVDCWGHDVVRKLSGPFEAKRIEGLRDIVEVVIGEIHTCARQATGIVHCWSAQGWIEEGELGDGDGTPRMGPVGVTGITDAQQVDLVNRHTCVLRRDQSIWCWGQNEHGQLGDGTTERRLTPVRVEELGPVKQIAVGGFATCALRGSGEVFCWGSNAVGQLGIGEGSDSRRPARVAGLSDVVEIDAGITHACARRSQGEVLCWGKSCDGRLGDDSCDAVRSPRALKGLPPATWLRVGGVESCIGTATGEVHCWGAAGESLSSHMRDRSLLRPRRVKLPPVVSVAPSTYHSCALVASGQVYCWGARALFDGDVRSGLWEVF